MKGRDLHGWRVGVDEAKDIQRTLADQVVDSGDVQTPQFIAGVDIAGEDGSGMARGAVVVLRYPDLEVVESSAARAAIEFPYVPGLLSFREMPVILAAFEGLALTPDIVMVDGQGVAHPRRLGLASHLGLILGLPTIGCAKSILCGRHGELGVEAGSCADLIDGGEVVGAALRTKTGVKPIYVSVGHRIGLDAARGWALACCCGYRLPEPTRLAHLAAAGRLPAVVKAGDGR